MRPASNNGKHRIEKESWGDHDKSRVCLKFYYPRLKAIPTSDYEWKDILYFSWHISFRHLLRGPLDLFYYCALNH